MGEYAKRKADGVVVKIGTCEEMYYLRFEDRHLVTREPNSLDPVAECGVLRFRLPFPDEDGIEIGEYKHYARGLRLYRRGAYGCNERSQLYQTDPWLDCCFAFSTSVLSSSRIARTRNSRFSCAT